LSGIFPEGFPTRFACGNDTKKNMQIMDALRSLPQGSSFSSGHISGTDKGGVDMIRFCANIEKICLF